MPDELKMDHASIDALKLDPKNPRLGRHVIDMGLHQDKILEIMQDWSIEELAVSLLESGFWPQEALIVVEEPVPGIRQPSLVVVEGNRRLAALMMIQKAREGTAPRKWAELLAGYKQQAFNRLNRIPYILMPSRKEIQSYLGFRHVTGIKEWNPAEKAEFIAKLIEEEELSYDQVRKRIGSKGPTVRQSYISYRLLLQMEDEGENVDLSKVEERFSVLYLSLGTDGVKKYLDINIKADPEHARTPVPPEKLQQLANFALWLFGSEDKEPLIPDSRQVAAFGKVLESPAAVSYLERSESPSFSVAQRMAGVAESELTEHVERAADELEEALRAAHQHKSSKRLQVAVRRATLDALQLLDLFPALKKEIGEQFCEEFCEDDS